VENPAENVRTRPASLADVTRLSGLLTLLFEQEADFTPDVGKQERALRMILENADTGGIFCAESMDGIVGMVSILFSVSTTEGGRVAWLEDMIVHPDWRGLGIGERLLQEAIGGARTAACLRITLLTDLTNDSAMRFYERSGFTRSRMTPMRLKL
jgi:GNAT superfamily N-acetyltransferase